MSKQESRRLSHRLYRQITELSSSVNRAGLNWLLRSYCLLRRSRYAANAGFVLPTSILVLLVLTLAVTTFMFRLSNRTTQVATRLKEQTIFNSATPAIDRAKAKLENLFREDVSFLEATQTDLPTDTLIGQFLQDDLNGDGTFPDEDDDGDGIIEDEYTLSGETRLDLDGDGVDDNAWSFQSGDITIAYSILSTVDNGSGVTLEADDSAKANALVIRNGPLSAVNSSTCTNLSLPAEEEGWFPTTSATYRKAFQVTAVALRPSDTENNRVLATLELQQNREASRKNKVGIWYRDDLEIIPDSDVSSTLRWNGAMHTEGSLIVGGDDDFVSYLVSSPRSCVFNRTASEITVTEQPDGADADTNSDFQGQILDTASTKTAQFHLFSTQINDTEANSNGTTNALETNLTVSTDSVTPDSTAFTDIALDPIKLIIESISRSLTSTNNFSNTGFRDSGWANETVVEKGRIFNQLLSDPFQFDTYRADDRWGPIPAYSNDLSIPAGTAVNGDDIVAVSGVVTADDVDSLTRETQGPDGEGDFGLDGYWERRARAQGVRIIVGPRLELGNSFGWVSYEDADDDGVFYENDDQSDPLNPPEPDALDACDSSDVTNRCHEKRQLKALRDNLAAVQAAAVYHYENESGNFPVACVAVTSHPGTQKSIADSTTFETDTNVSKLVTNFLSGEGTNGLEFESPGGVTTESAFINLIDQDIDPLRRALSNLAHLAGDPFGSFPASQDTDDGTDSNDAVPSVGPEVHPYPTLSMWGNFSELRRVIELLDGGTAYADLSLADKTTLHTASCTLGMLAYSLDTEIAIFDYLRNNTNLQSEGVDLSKLLDSTCSGGNPEIVDPSLYGGSSGGGCSPLFGPSPAAGGIDSDTWVDPDPNTVIPSLCPSGTDGNGFDEGCDEPEVYSEFTPDQIMEAAGLTTSEIDLLETIAVAITSGNQITRDRTLGFATGGPLLPSDISSSGVNYDPDTGLAGPEQIGGASNAVIKTGCDPDLLESVTNPGGGGGSNDRANIGLALILCQNDITPRYPSLYYLFPAFDHDHNGDDGTGSDVVGLNLGSSPYDGVNHTQPSDEPYIDAKYIFDDDASITDDVNHDFTYKVLDSDGADDGIEVDTSEDSLDEIAIEPQTTNNLPTGTSGPNEITVDGSTVAVPFLDKGIFDGREMMGIRVLDIDLDLLRKNKLGTGDYWLPLPSGLTETGAILYAFREDAVREDAIVRPNSTTWTNCDTVSEITGTSCRMDAFSASPQDPPIDSTTEINTKPVDYYADPDRRPYGFRLRNGADLRRVDSGTTVTADLRGMTFVSDNPVYIQGNFNRHRDSSNNDIEEFTQTLTTSNWGNFYGRSTLDSDFASTGDRWRPVEIIADAITLLSGSFVDGWITQGVIGNGTSSYRALNRPDPSSTRYWLRLDGTASELDDSDVPIEFSPNGLPLFCTSDPGSGSCPESDISEYPNSDPFLDFTDDKTDAGGGDLVNDATATTINAVLIGGIIPSRANQFNGGLTNFPRLLEDWDTGGTGVELRFNGAFIQRAFSTYATGPYDQDAWEPGATPTADSSSNGLLDKYYSDPDRLWGYDVGLQYAPAGPALRNSVTFSNTRSEFYQELPSDDSYVCELRAAIGNSC